MSRPHLRHSTSILALSLLVTPSIAQNNTAPDLSTCLNTIGTLSSTAHVNTTGNQPFRFANPYSGDEDWYLSVTLNDTRSSLLVSTLHDIQGYISVPDEVEGDACIYMFSGLDAAPGDGANGCEGLLSEDCINFLKREIRYPVSSARDREGRVRCYPAPMDDEARRVCGDALFQGGVVSNSFAQDLANSTCTISSPPGVSIPENYLTHPATGFGAAPGRSDILPWNFTWYDRYVRRPIPWVIAGSFNNSLFLETQVVCAAPSTVLEGSRVPEGEFPEGLGDQNAGVSVDWRFTERMVWTAAGVATVVLMLG